MNFDFMETLELLLLIKKRAIELYRAALGCKGPARGMLLDDARRFKAMYRKTCDYYNSEKFFKHI